MKKPDEPCDGRALAHQAPPLSEEQVEKAAWILATVRPGEGRPWPAPEGVVRDAKSVERDGT